MKGRPGVKEEDARLRPVLQLGMSGISVDAGTHESDTSEICEYSYTFSHRRADEAEAEAETLTSDGYYLALPGLPSASSAPCWLQS